MSLRLLLFAGLLSSLPLAATAHEGHKPASVSHVAVAPADEATKVVDRFHQAITNGDLVEAAALLANEAVIYEHGGVEHTKAEYVARHLPEDAAYSRGMKEEVRGRSAHVSGKLAWVITEGRTTETHNDKPVRRLTTETAILKGTASGWKIVHIHWSSGNEPASR